MCVMASNARTHNTHFDVCIIQVMPIQNKTNTIYQNIDLTVLQKLHINIREYSAKLSKNQIISKPI